MLKAAEQKDNSTGSFQVLILALFLLHVLGQITQPL